jgi:hypothetical protein
MLELLLKAGADINGTTTGLATPLMVAFWQKKLPLAKLLLGGCFQHGIVNIFVSSCQSVCSIFVHRLQGCIRSSCL